MGYLIALLKKNIHPSGRLLVQSSNGNSRKIPKIYSQSSIKIKERRQWRLSLYLTLNIFCYFDIWRLWSSKYRLGFFQKVNFSATKQKHSKHIRKPFVVYFSLDGGPYHIEINPLICSANQKAGFYIIETSVMKKLSVFFVKFLYTSIISNCVLSEHTSLTHFGKYQF